MLLMRAKLVFEKFTEDENDPIKDMGIGVYSPHEFETSEQLYEFLYDIIPTLFKVKKPIELIAKSKPLYFTGNVVKDLKQYIKKYIKVNGPEFYWVFNVPSFYNYLVKRAAKEEKKEKLKESLNEKFTEDSDPISDMGIGITAPHSFKTEDEFVNYLINAVIPYIYGGEIPKNILYYTGYRDEDSIIPMQLFNDISDFTKKYKYSHPYKRGWCNVLKLKLINKGFIVQ